MNYPFSDTLTYLITQISTSMMQIISRRFDEYGISIPMYRALVVLRDGQIRTLGELAGIVAIEQSTLSRQVGMMVRNGLVTRIRSENNGRIVQIEITPEGRRIVEQLIPFVVEIDRAAPDALSPEQVQAFKLCLKQVEANLAAFRESEFSSRNDV